MDIKELLGLIQAEIPNQTTELAASFDLMQIVLAETVVEAQRLITEHMGNHRYDRVRNLVNLAESINKLESEIDIYLDLLDTGVAEDEVVDEDEEERFVGVTDYAQYTVDHNVAHSLYDDFKHVRPYGFALGEGRLYQVSAWKEMVVLLCQHLNRAKPGILDTFPKDRSMNGRKNAYFAVTPEGLREPKEITKSLFLHSNQSANALRNLMLKILLKFGVKPSEMKVYFKADYSSIPSRR